LDTEPTLGVRVGIEVVLESHIATVHELSYICVCGWAPHLAS